MKKALSVPFWAAVCLWLILPVSNPAQGSKSSPARPPQQKIDAAALLAEICSSPPQGRSTMEGVLDIRAADGSLRKVPIKWSVRPLEDQWHDVYQTPNNSIVPPETLVVVHREKRANQYEHRRNGIPVPEATAGPFIPFATSDFWLGDLGLEFLHWPDPKHLKTEMRKSRPCYVIESRNPGGTNGPYARVLSWIDTENRGLIRAEAYDVQGGLLKEFSIAKLDKDQGRWRIKELLIRNDQAGTQTRLIFNLEIESE